MTDPRDIERLIRDEWEVWLQQAGSATSYTSFEAGYQVAFTDLTTRLAAAERERDELENALCRAAHLDEQAGARILAAEANLTKATEALRARDAWAASGVVGDS